MKKTMYMESQSTDPAFTLALEQYVFDSMPRDREYFWLWQNHNTIVVGKHQNTAEEINQAFVQEHGIQVVRRLSGGGAVYHDLGNINFTFICDTGSLEQLNLQAFCQPVVRTLAKIGVTAQTSGRNDITIDGKKFSGNSQYVKGQRIMHHGTLMFDSDLSVVGRALEADPAKYESKGFKSVRSRVTNIKPYLAGDMGIQEFQGILKEYMLQGNDVETYQLTSEDIRKIQRIQMERYDTWEWNYGASPRYSVRKKRRFEGCGHMEVCMNVEQGRIQAFESFGDYFGNGATKELQERLIGCCLKGEALKRVLEGFDLEGCYHNLDREEFVEFLLEG